MELIATIGWSGDPNLDIQGDVEFFITQDNIRVVSNQEEILVDPNDLSADILQTTTFQGVLTNVSTGHHVYRLFISNLEPLNGVIFVVGPVTMSGKVIAP